jgi:hypothetical protein
LIVIEADAVLRSESATVMVALKTPACNGDPLIEPAPAVTPGGSPIVEKV